MKTEQRKMTRWTLAALALLSGSVIAPAVAVAQETVASLQSRIEASQVGATTALDSLTLTDLMKRFGVPGVSIAVIKDFRVHWAKGYGVADVASGRPVEIDTRFQAASISKPVTAMAAMRLVQEKKLGLDTDINAILKSWRVPVSDFTREQPVTPRSLVSHTSGANDGFGFPGYAPDAPLPSVVQILNGEPPSNVGKVLFARPPFQRVKYSGGGVTIMQLALTELTGKPFAELMSATVLRPLGMTQSSFEQPPARDAVSKMAWAHDREGRSRGAPWHVYPEQAAAGLWTTPTDLATFVIEVQNAVAGPRGRVLDQMSAREMVTPVGVGAYAVGLSISMRGEGWYFGHGGSNWGFMADILGHVRKGYGVVVMTNGDNGNALIRQIEARIAAVYAWDMLDKPLPR